MGRGNSSAALLGQYRRVPCARASVRSSQEFACDRKVVGANADRDGQGGSPGLPGPRTVCSLQGCIRWTSDTHTSRGSARALPVELGTVEYLIGTLALKVPRQDDGQEALATGLVVQGLLRLHLQGRVQADLSKVGSVQGWARSPAQETIPGRRSPFLRGATRCLSVRGGGGAYRRPWRGRG